jgi:hypothetical protein
MSSPVCDVPHTQQFELGEQQSRDLEHQQIHVHLHLHLFMQVRRSSPLTTARVTTIFAAYMGALSMSLTLGVQVAASDLPQQPLVPFGSTVILVGALLGLGIVLSGGIALVLSAWRSTPRSRLLLAPLLTLGLTILCPVLITLGQVMTASPLDALGPPFTLALLFFGVSISSAIVIQRAFGQATISDIWLRLITIPSRLVGLGMLLMLIGVDLWLNAAILASAWDLLIFLGMLIAVVAALQALFSLAPASQPLPRDDPPYDVAPSHEQAPCSADPSRE